MSSTTIISDPALTVHRSWCDRNQCRADRQGADNTGNLDAMTEQEDSCQ